MRSQPSFHAACGEIARQESVVPAPHFAFPEAERMEPGTHILEGRAAAGPRPIQQDRLVGAIAAADQDVARMHVTMDGPDMEGPLLQKLVAQPSTSERQASHGRKTPSEHGQSG